MAKVAKENRVYPYNIGLLIGSEIDIVLTNKNSEPLNSENLIGKSKICVNKSGGSEVDQDGGQNSYGAHNGMVRVSTRFSYCRAYSIDNLWWTIKELIIKLKKRAHVSYLPSPIIDDITSLEDRLITAGGHIKCTIVEDKIYGSIHNKKLCDMTYNHASEANKRLLNNFRLLLGIPNLLLDKRDVAKHRRKILGPGTPEEFRKSDVSIVYQTCSNFWLFSPILAHMMLGAARMAYFLTVNEIESEIWEGFDDKDVNNAILNSDYQTGKEIWRIAKDRLSDCGYKDADNPFFKDRNMLIDFLEEYGVGIIGNSVYKNWQVARKKENFRGHFAQLPSWENGALTSIFNAKHSSWNTLSKFRENYGKEQTK